MDITQQAVNETSELHLCDATGEPLYDGEGEQKRPVTVVLYGPGSKQYVRAQAAQNRRVLEAFRAKGRKADTSREDNAQFLADCTVEFRRLEYGGLEGVELAKAVYADASIGFIAEQVSKHLGDWANFTKGSPTT